MKHEGILKNWQLNAGATADSISSAVASLGRHLPPDYVQFLKEHDGGEGFIGDNYLILWKIEELNPFNREYEVEQYAPGILLFGSDGGGEGYGFDTRDAAMPIIRVPFIGMNLCYATVVADSFTGLCLQLAK